MHRVRSLPGRGAAQAALLSSSGTSPNLTVLSAAALRVAVAAATVGLALAAAAVTSVSWPAGPTELSAAPALAASAVGLALAAASLCAAAAHLL